METPPPISIVIVNYRSVGRLARLFESLIRLESALKETAEIIVVNNDPLESRALKNLNAVFHFSLIENHNNTGFARGANIGALAASGEYIGFINPDTLWKQSSLSQLLFLFQAHPHVGIIGMHLIDPFGLSEPWGFGKHPSLFRILRNNLFFPEKSLAQKYIRLMPADWTSGGGLFIRKSLFQNLGGFDERFFLYFEDADLCLQTKKSGWEVRIATELPLIHAGGKSQESLVAQKEHFYSSQSSYFKKHRPKWEYWLLHTLRFIRHGL